MSRISSTDQFIEKVFLCTLRYAVLHPARLSDPLERAVTAGCDPLRTFRWRGKN